MNMLAMHENIIPGRFASREVWMSVFKCQECEFGSSCWLQYKNMDLIHPSKSLFFGFSPTNLHKLLLANVRIVLFFSSAIEKNLY